jgi:hypothetical protein
VKRGRIEEVDVHLNRWLLALWALWSNLEWVYKISSVEYCRDSCTKALLAILGSGMEAQMYYTRYQGKMDGLKLAF